MLSVVPVSHMNAARSLLVLCLLGCNGRQPMEPPPLDEAEARALVASTATPRFVTDGYVSRIVDGDTAVLRNAIWFGVTAEMSCRLVEVDAPELVGADKAAGLAWKAKLQELLPVNTKVRVRSFALDRYGRVLVVIERGGVSVNKELVEAMAAAAAERKAT